MYATDKYPKHKNKSYAIFSGDVKAKDKYKLEHPPTLFFKTRKLAKKFADMNLDESYKIMTYKDL